MPGYPLTPGGNAASKSGWTGAAANSTAPDGGHGPGYSEPYLREKADDVLLWLKATGNQAMDMVSDRALHEYEAHVAELGRRLLGATTWTQVYTAAKLILGPNCYYLGVAVGAASNLTEMVEDLLGLWKMLTLAAMYELGGNGAPSNGWIALSPATAMLSLEGRLFRSFGGAAMEEADKNVRALVDQLGKIMRDPVKYLGKAWGSTKREYIAKWNRHLQLLRDGGLASQFEAGKLAGEVLAQVMLAVLGIVSGVGAAVRGAELAAGVGEELAALSREAPEVLKVARGLEEVEATRVGGAVRAVEEGGAEAGGPSTTSSKGASTAKEPPSRSAAPPGSFGKVPETIKTSSGVDIHPTPGKTTTVLGNYRADMEGIINKQLDYPKTTNLNAKPSGFNLLNVPDDIAHSMTPDEFWAQYNKPLLDQALQRGDPIAIATRPTASVLVRPDGTLTGFGREMEYLQQNGYRYDPATGMAVGK